MERIYNTLKGEQLQHWLTVAIIRDESTKSAFVEFRSTIHVNKASRLTQSWGTDFSDSEILNDNIVLRAAYDRYGRDIFTGLYARDF